MKPTAAEFLAQPKKAITVIGMSGLGKTYTASMLSRYGWEHYSCDEIIGTEYLAHELSAPVTKQNLAPLSAFVGQLGDPLRGGLGLDEFKRRQKMYYDAECESLRHVGAAIATSEGSFVNDSTGSLCEITDENLIAQVGGQTLFVYFKASAEDEDKLLRRAANYPKPLFFPPDQFDQWLKDFMVQNRVHDVRDIDPNRFSRWVFPILFRSRLPKYQRLADLYGITVPSAAMLGIKTEDAFIDVIARALDS